MKRLGWILLLLGLLPGPLWILIELMHTYSQIATTGAVPGTLEIDFESAGTIAVWAIPIAVVGAVLFIVGLLRRPDPD